MNLAKIYRDGISINLKDGFSAVHYTIDPENTNFLNYWHQYYTR